MSDVPIDLDSTEELTTLNYVVTANKREYELCKVFGITGYSIKYKDDIEFPYEMFIFLSKKPYGAFCTLRTEKVIDTVVVIYNNYNPEVPLLIGFYAAYEKKFFTYQYLKEENTIPFSTDEYIGDHEMMNKLVEENNRVNKKLKFMVNKYTSNINVNELRMNFDTFYRVTYTPQHDQVRESVVFSNYMLNIKENDEIYEDRLDAVHSKYYDAVMVYFSGRFVNRKVPLLVEFVSDGKTYFFSRLQNESEVFWRQLLIKSDNHMDELSYIVRSTDRLVELRDESDESVFGDGRVEDVIRQYPTLYSDPKATPEPHETQEHHEPHETHHYQKPVEDLEAASSGAVQHETQELIEKINKAAGPQILVSFLVATLGLCCGMGCAFLFYRYYYRSEIRMQRFY